LEKSELKEKMSDSFWRGMWTATFYAIGIKTLGEIIQLGQNDLGHWVFTMAFLGFGTVHALKYHATMKKVEKM